MRTGVHMKVTVSSLFVYVTGYTLTGDSAEHQELFTFSATRCNIVTQKRCNDHTGAAHRRNVPGQRPPAVRFDGRVRPKQKRMAPA
jgi:hypothetical protein